MAPLLFVHIPKTAGSSFRKGIDRLFGEDASIRDYGLKSPETSDEVRRSFYADADPWKLRGVLSAGKKRMLVGHFPVMRYAGLFDARRIFTIVRDPVQRVVSEYGHFSRHYGFKGTLLQFARQAPFSNKQANILRGAPVEAFGLVGLTERYEDTLRLFEHSFGYRPNLLRENNAREDLSARYELSQVEKTELRKLNGHDLALYGRATTLFEQRIAAMANSEEIVRGRVTRVERGVVKGWAVRDSDDTPVLVEIVLDDEIIGTVSAVEFRPILNGLGLGRGGYIGFSFNLPKDRGESNLHCRAQGTRQYFLNAWD